MHPVVVLPWMDNKRILILERKISNCSCAELASLQEGAYILNGYIGKLLLDLFVQQVPTTVTTADMKIIDLVEQVLTGQVLEVGVDLHKPADDLAIHLNFSHLEPSLVIIV